MEDRQDHCQKYYLKKLDEIYNTGECSDGGYDKLIDNTIINSEQLTVLTNAIQRKNKLDMIRENTGSDSAILINAKKKRIIKEQTRVINDKDHSKYYTVIEAYPKEVIVYDSPLTEEPRTFQIRWDSELSAREFTTGGEIGGGGISEIESQLENAGYCPNPRLLKGSVSSVISAYIKHKLATIKKDVDYPGFFYDDDKEKIVNIKYDIKPPEKKELKKAVDILEDLKQFFKGQEDKLATCLKWGWLGPFNYVKKQKGTWLPWLYMYGTAGTGKTVLGRIILLLWNEPDEKNDMGGSSFDTPARVGNRISQSTFPILVNEPAGAFGNDKVTEMFKSSVENTTARGKYVSNRYTVIPALAPIIFTANQFTPNHDGILRRLLMIRFSHNERKSEKEKKVFEDEFNLNLPNISSLNHLKSISCFFANEILSDINLISDEWQELANTLLHTLYGELDLEVPEWLLGWVKSQTLEDFDDDQKEELRMFFIDLINNKTRNIQVFEDEEGYRRKQDNITSETIKGSSSFYNRVWYILNERLISWMIPVHSRGKDYVCFTQGLKKDLHKETEVCQDLKSIAELLGWKYQPVRLTKGANPTRVIKIRFDKFVSYLFPELELDSKED